MPWAREKEIAVNLITQTKTLARGVIENLPHGEALVDTYRRENRVRQARQFLEAGRLYPEEREAILRDFKAICLNTQLSIAGIINLETVARATIASGLEGAFVECGTWRGGSLGYWARSFMRNGGSTVHSSIFGLDSFQGMPRMTEKDGDSTAHWMHGKTMSDLAPELLNGELEPTGLNVATEQDCWAMLEGSGFPREGVTLAKGWFQDTLPLVKEKIGKIAVLRLDGDFYESTRVCIETLFDQVVAGGVVIVDDYGAFPGCKRAIDEFIAERQLSERLLYVDSSVRYFYKGGPR